MNTWSQRIGTFMQKRLVNWRWLSILILGISCNFFINWIFNFRSPIETFQLEEYLVAIVVAGLILEGIRLVNRKVTPRLTSNRKTRARVSLLLVDISLVLIVINLVGTAYMLLVYGDTYTRDEYLVINLITLSFTVIIILPELYAQPASSSSEDTITAGPLMVRFGNTMKSIDPDHVLLCYVENSLTYLVTAEGKYVVDLNLGDLLDYLPSRSFIRANRQWVISRSVIDRIKSATFGKIEVYLRTEGEHPSRIVVSRKHAASFRKWFKKQ